MNPSISPTSRLHVGVGAAFAALQILAGAAALGDVFGAKVYGLFAIVVAAAQAGWSYWVSATSIPTSAVAAIATPTGEVVAGPAAEQTNGTLVEIRRNLDGE